MCACLETLNLFRIVNFNDHGSVFVNLGDWPVSGLKGLRCGFDVFVLGCCVA